MFNNLVNSYKQILAPVQQGLTNIEHAAVNEYHALPQQAQNLGNTVVRNIANTPIYRPLSFLPGGAPLRVAADMKQGPTIGDYIHGQLVKPLQTLTNSQAPALDRIGSGIQLGFNALPASHLFNLGVGGVSGALKTMREGGSLNKNTSQAIANGSDVAGTGLGIKNPFLAMPLDIALTRNPKNIANDLKSIKNVAQAIKGYSPNAFNIHPEDQAIMKDFVNRVQGGGAKMDLGQIGKDAQVLAQHYIGEKARNLSNEKLAQAFDALLSHAAVKNGQDAIQTPFPKMGIAGKQQLSTEGVVSKGKIQVKPMPTQVEIKNRAELNAGKPDLATQRRGKLIQAGIPVGEEKPLGGLPTPKEQASIDQMDKLIKSGDKKLNIKLSGGKFQSTEGIPMDTKPQESFQNGKPISPPAITTSLNKQDVKLAKLARFSTNQDIQTRANILARSLDSTIKKPQEVALFRDTLENPHNLEINAQKARNPQAFKQLVAQFQDFTNHVYSTQVNSGNATINKVQNYFPHIFDMENPKVQELIKQKDQANEGLMPPSKNSNSFVNKPRTFKNLQEAYQWAAQNGIKPEELMKNKSLGGDVQDFARANQRDVGSRILATELEKRFPNEVYISKSGEAGPPGLLQSRVIGNGGTYLSPRLIKATENLEPVQLPKALKALDDVNAIQKGLKLAGGGFHYYNVGKGYAATSLAQGKLPSVIGTTRAVFSQKFFDNSMRNWAANGTLEKAGHYGVDINSNEMQAASLGDKIQHYIENNPLTKPLFKRMIPYMQMKLVEGAPKYDTATEVGKKAAMDYGRQINMAVGIINSSIGDSLVNNPMIKFGMRQGALAPMYNEAKFGQLASALNVTKWDAPHNVARGSILLGALITAGIAEGARKIVTGNFSPDLQQAIANDFIDPSVPLPFQDKKGRNLVVKLPGSAVTDLPRLATDPLHYAQSHLGANASDVLSFLTNKNYYGKALSNTNNPVVKAGKIAYNNLPIPVVQGLEAAQGNQSVKESIINTMGGRVALDKNDPQVASTNAYFAGLKQVQNSLQSDPDTLDKFNAIHPTKQDAEGNKIPSTTIGSDKYDMLLRNPKVLQAEIAFQQSQPNHEPLWDLNSQSTALVLASRDRLPGQPTNQYGKILQKQPWYPAFMQQENQYFSTLPPSANPNQTTNMPKPTPNAYVQAQLNAKNYNDPQVQAYFKANDSYNNSLLTSMNLPPIAGSNSSGYSRKPKKISLKLPKSMKMPKIKVSKLKQPKTYKLTKVKSNISTSLPKTARIKKVKKIA